MISIITPVLNGRQFIQNSIESIQKLNIPYEHIVVDGGSTDGTIDLVKNYSHIKLLHQTENNGMYGAIHQGVMSSQGEYVTWINADDKIIPEGYIELYIKANEHNADLAYSHGINHFINKYYYKKVFAKHFCRYFLKQGIVPFIQPSVIFSRRAYNLVGGLNYNNLRLIGDRDLFQRMAWNRDIKFLYVSSISSVFLQHDNSLLNKNLDKRKDEYKYCIKTNIKWYHRILFHLSQIIRSYIWTVSKLFEKKNTSG